MESSAATEDPALRRREGWKLALRSLLGAVALLGAVFVLARAVRPDLEALGGAFVRRFGLLGMAVGTFLADGLHFPVPPQFYLLTAVTAGGSQLAAVAAISAGSVLGGHAAYHLAVRLARFKFFRRYVDRTRGRVDALFRRYGYWALAVGSVTPMPYSLLCYLSGLYRVPYRYFAFFTLLRVPRIVFFYLVIRAGWHA